MSYWQRYSRPISRRTALMTTGAGAVGAAFLAACGSESGGGKIDAPGGLVYTPADTSKQAKPGGTLQTYGSEPESLDALVLGVRASILSTAAFAYPKLLKTKLATYPDLWTDGVEGDLAESWELSPDKLKLTMRLRQGLKWDLTSGRTIDAQDVAWSWNKFSSRSPYAANIANSRNSQQPVESITAVDARTISVNLAFPDPAVFGMLAQTSVFMVAPREGESAFDPRHEVHGYGPFNFLEKYEPSVGMTWRKNPDYYVKGRPFFDRVRVTFIPEYASRLAQFRAGNIWTSVANVNDVLTAKRDLPDTILEVTPDHLFDSGPCVIFSYEQGSPWKDQRVRQAVALLIDRDSTKELATNEQEFSKQGIPRGVKAQNVISPGWHEHYIDPLNEKEFGTPAHKWFKRDVAEAKRLLSAAGFANGFETSLFSLSTWTNQSVILLEQVLEGGIRGKYELLNSQRWFDTVGNAYNDGKHSGFGSTGFALRAVTSYVDPATTIQTTDAPGARSFIGMTRDGNNPHQGDPDLTPMVRALRNEFDAKKSISLAHDYARAMAAKAYRVPMWWSALGVRLSWPVIGNLGYYRAHPRSFGVPDGIAGISPHEEGLHLWMDETKAPIKKA